MIQSTDQHPDDEANPAVEYHSQSGTYRTKFDSATRTVSEAVIATVASAQECDPLELPPLFETVDPDSLDALFASRPETRSDTEASIEFRYAGHAVTVRSRGTVVVEPN